MNLETMQREGRKGIKQQHNFEILFGAGSMAEQACESFLDQHTANTWNEARESLIVDMKRTMKGWLGTGTAMIKDYETLARDYD